VAAPARLPYDEMLRDDIEQLHRCPLFREAGLGPEVLGDLARLSTPQWAQAGEVVICEADEGDSMYVITRGRVRVDKQTPYADTYTVTFLEAEQGGFFGELALLDRDLRSASVVAETPCEFLVIRREDFLAFLEREPKVAIKIMMLLCQRIRWQSERMEESVLQPLPVRLARRLCALASDFGSEVHISQEQLGVFVGAARESVNRQLQLWRKDGILDLQRGRILLQNMTKLTAVARND